MCGGGEGGGEMVNHCDTNNYLNCCVLGAILTKYLTD